MFHAGWMAVMGDNMTYNWHSMLVGNYGSTLFNTSFGFPTYIRHSSSKSLFENLEDDEITLGAAFSDRRGNGADDPIIQEDLGPRLFRPGSHDRGDCGSRLQCHHEDDEGLVRAHLHLHALRDGKECGDQVVRPDRQLPYRQSLRERPDGR